MKRPALAALLALFWSGAAAGAAPNTPLERGLEQVEDGQPLAAAKTLFPWVKDTPRVDARRAWAQLYLGRALGELGLNHAALSLQARLVLERENPDVLPSALKEVVRLMRAPHDERLVEDWVFGQLDVTSLPPELATVAKLRQGLRDLKNGHEKWARAHLSTLPKNAPAQLRAQFVLLSRELSAEQPDLASLSQRFAAVANTAGVDRRTRNEALLAQARLQYELRDFSGALEAYEKVQQPRFSPGKAHLYIEEAWTRYRAGNLHGAMGLLLPLESPAFRDELIPDKYVLRALVYRDLCYYRAARKQTQALSQRFAASLNTLRSHKPLWSDEQLRRATLRDGPSARAEAFVKALTQEQARLKSLRAQLGDPLYQNLWELYEVASVEAQRERTVRQAVALERAADDLLRAADHARRVDYEIGLTMNARKEPEQATVIPLAPAGPGEAAYPFQGELWNDELRSVRFRLPSRCSGQSPPTPGSGA